MDELSCKSFSDTMNPDEQKFLVTSENGGKPNYYNLKRNENDSYRDKVIHQLIQQKNSLEDDLKNQKNQYELKIRNLEISMETLKEHSGSRDLKANFEQLQQTNNYIAKRLQQQQQINEELEEQIEDLKNRLQLKEKQFELVEQKYEQNDKKEQIKGLILHELNNLKKLVNQQTPKAYIQLRKLIDNFVDKTIVLDECYYELLEQLDQKILKKSMERLGQLNGDRKNCLNILNKFIDNLL